MAGIGLNGDWGSAPHTSAMNGSAVVGQEIGTNGCLTLLAIAAADPKPPDDIRNCYGSFVSV